MSDMHRKGKNGQKNPCVPIKDKTLAQQDSKKWKYWGNNSMAHTLFFFRVPLKAGFSPPRPQFCSQRGSAESREGEAGIGAVEVGAGRGRGSTRFVFVVLGGRRQRCCRGAAGHGRAGERRAGP